MASDLLIVGQGVAGTLLGWQLERAGIAFEIADVGHAHAASRAAAGIINPITGRRLVPSWRVQTLLPMARETYRALEAELGETVWHELRIRRLFADDRERRAFSEKHARGELAPFVVSHDAAGCWIEGAARVDLTRLLRAARARWKAQGILREDRGSSAKESGAHALVIDCTGAAAASETGGAWAFVPWEFSKGEMLELEVAGLDRGVVLNRRHWILPVGDGKAWIGATHEPGCRDAEPSEAGRAMLERSARELLGERPFLVAGHRAGVRVTLQDKRPVAGRHPERRELGLVNALGAKGALLAPFLARQWVEHLTRGAGFDAEVDVARFAGANETPVRGAT